jgi:hypothetical protein
VSLLWCARQSRSWPEAACIIDKGHRHRVERLVVITSLDAKEGVPLRRSNSRASVFELKKARNTLDAERSALSGRSREI